MSTFLDIALVEDHSDLRDLYVSFLHNEGHRITGFSMADDLDDFLLRQHIDLLILDLNLPGENGYSIANRLSTANPSLQIIMLTARSAVADRIKGYASGANIYLSKPITPAELNAAVGSVVRRVNLQRTNQPQLVLNPTTLLLSGQSGCLPLTPSEVLLLKALSVAPRGKLDYWRLQELLVLESDDKGKAALEVRISRLKKKLHEAGASEPAIKAIWKEGYQLCVKISIQC